MNEAVQSPIVVNASPAADYLDSALRVLLVAAGGDCVGKGWLSPRDRRAVGGRLLIAGPFLWAQIEVVLKKRISVMVAQSASYSLAAVKS